MKHLSRRPAKSRGNAFALALACALAFPWMTSGRADGRRASPAVHAGSHAPRDTATATAVTADGLERGGVRLRRTDDLLVMFAQGDGRLERRAPAGRDQRSSPATTGHWFTLPWQVDDDRAPSVGLFHWSFPERSASEAVAAFRLGPDERWCVFMPEIEAGARLRLEAIQGRREERPLLRVEWQATGAGPRVLRTLTPAMPQPLAAETQSDVALLPGRGELCLAAQGGEVVLGEPRILAPEVPGADPRAPWIVLIVGDSLRGDVLDEAGLAFAAPTLTALARGGHRYSHAVTPGCHTRASVWALMTGRDMLRVDPLLRGGVNPQFSGAEAIYSRGNLFVSQYAWEHGYHSVFLGNNAFFAEWPAFHRLATPGDSTTGTEDTMARLPALFRRYSDERVMLTYYDSAAHMRMAAPTRLLAELGCGRLTGDAEARCDYAARVRHFDESLSALEVGLSSAGLGSSATQVITADHGEALEDVLGIEAEVNGRGHWLGVNRSHGMSCEAQETRVPLVMVGPTATPRTWAQPVSTLDVVPTLLTMLGARPVGLLDGRVLPGTSGQAGSPERPLVSYGFCSDSLEMGGQQLIRWVSDCGGRRSASNHAPVTWRDQLWVDGHLAAATGARNPALDRLIQKHQAWVSDRMPSEMVLLDLTGLAAARITVTAEAGQIVDYGPSNSVFGLAGLTVSSLAERALQVDVAHFEGTFFVATAPPRVPLRLTVEPQRAGEAVTTYVGPLQVPLKAREMRFDPSLEPALFFSATRPPRQPFPERQLRVWWQVYAARSGTARAATLAGFDRVLRDWGYIR
jgi:hypothetical protein